MGELVHITARIEAETRDALKLMAKARMMKTGEVTTLADIVREALDKYAGLARLAVRAEQKTAEENMDLFDQAPPKRRGPENAEIIAKARELLAQGMNQRQVAAELGISQSKVSKMLKK
ncbi:helix-turn-helix domain-containing protein [Pseudomonas luteola]|uniref:helix-turn-helix domain-containing protein n=1 Tax=Pseudomonas luteola TaxID=47886 RepID=UPI003A89BF5E